MLFVASCNPHLDLLHSLLDITQLLITKVCAWRKCAGEYKPDHGEFGIKQYASSALEHLSVHIWVVPIVAANTVTEFGYLEGRDKLGGFSESLLAWEGGELHDASKHIVTNVAQTAGGPFVVEARQQV